MRSILHCLLFLASLNCVQASFFGFGQNELEVITNTDVTPAGALLARPTPQKPIYYVALDLGFKDIGGIVAGDKVPPRKQVNAVMQKVLAKQGYLPASNKHAPEIVLTWFWGTLYVDRMPSMNPELPDRQINKGQMLRFLGGKKLNVPGSGDMSAFPEFESAFGLNIVTPDQERFMDAATEDLYVIAIGGYDLASIKSRKPKLLWTTRIAAPSRGFVLADTLPAMAAIGGPNIGRETVKPVWVSADEKFKAEVLIGPTTVVPDSAPGQGKPEQKDK